MMRALYVRVWRFPDVFIESKQTGRRGKEISSNRPGFVCFSSSVLPYSPIHSISQNVLPPFRRSASLFIFLKRFTDFLSFTYLFGPRAIVTILSQSLLHVQHFSGNYLARTGQSPKCWRGQSSEIASAIPARYVRISATFAIGNFTPSMKLIVHIGSFEMRWPFAPRSSLFVSPSLVLSIINFIKKS